jgi:hypothetical protein
MHEPEAPAAERDIAAPALPIWAWLAAAVATALFWTVMMEAGAVAAAVGESGPFLHELFHDGRHLIGVPCH